MMFCFISICKIKMDEFEYFVTGRRIIDNFIHTLVNK